MTLERFCKEEWSQIPLSVMGEDCAVLLTAQREVVQSIKCRGANNCGTCGFITNNYFLMRFYFFRINVLQLKVGFF